MLEMLCKGQLSTLIMDGRESSHSVDVFFVKIVIEWECLWWNQLLLVLNLNVMSLLVT